MALSDVDHQSESIITPSVLLREVGPLAVSLLVTLSRSSAAFTPVDLLWVEEDDVQQG